MTSFALNEVSLPPTRAFTPVHLAPSNRSSITCVSVEMRRFARMRVTGSRYPIGAETRISDLISATIDARYFRAFGAFATEDDVDFLPHYLAVTVGRRPKAQP